MTEELGCLDSYQPMNILNIVAPCLIFKVHYVGGKGREVGKGGKEERGKDGRTCVVSDDKSTFISDMKDNSTECRRHGYRVMYVILFSACGPFPA